MLDPKFLRENIELVRRGVARKKFQVDLDAVLAADPGVAAKAWRWEPEMREVAEVMRASGIPDELALGAAAALQRWAPLKDRDDLGTAEVLDLLRDR